MIEWKVINSVEDLPEEAETVMVTVVHKDGRRATTAAYWVDEDGMDWRWADDGNEFEEFQLDKVNWSFYEYWTDCTAIAWALFPEPYLGPITAKIEF